MNTIKTIDLWTEQKDNQIECFCGAFIDGFDNENIPYDAYKVVRNVNCIITSNSPGLNVRNKHNAIVFYKDGVPVRLMVVNKDTNIDECISKALNQTYNDDLLINLFIKNSITSTTIDMKEEPIEKDNIDEELDVGSSDRHVLLKSMLLGSYTEDLPSSDTEKKTYFPKEYMVRYFLMTDKEVFRIMHRYGFQDKDRNSLLPLQEEGFKKKH